MLRILIHDRSGHAFPVQLSRELARRGHQVLHSYAVFFQTPKGDLLKRKTDPPSFSVEGLRLEQEFHKYSFVKRYFQEREYARKLVRQIKEFAPDILLMGQAMPDAQTYIYRKLRFSDMKKVFWVQDLYGLAIQRILRKKLLLAGDLIGRYYIFLEHRLMQQSDALVLITEDFMPLLHQWGVSQDKAYVIPNWASLESIPVQLKINRWSESHDLADKFCFLYAGTLGMKHNPQLLLELALRFQNDDQVKVVVVSEGLGADWLLEKKKQYSIDGLKLLDFQSFDQFAYTLGAADVLVAILEPDAGIFSVPSKVLSYLCAKRPLLVAIPRKNMAAKIVQENDLGIAVDPNDIESFVEAAKILRKDPHKRAYLQITQDDMQINISIFRR